MRHRQQILPELAAHKMPVVLICLIFRTSRLSIWFERVVIKYFSIPHDRHAIGGSI
jgi:hypothetical protein